MVIRPFIYYRFHSLGWKRARRSVKRRLPRGGGKKSLCRGASAVPCYLWFYLLYAPGRAMRAFTLLGCWRNTRQNSFVLLLVVKISWRNGYKVSISGHLYIVCYCFVFSLLRHSGGIRNNPLVYAVEKSCRWYSYLFLVRMDKLQFRSSELKGEGIRKSDHLFFILSNNTDGCTGWADKRTKVSWEPSRA